MCGLKDKNREEVLFSVYHVCVCGTQGPEGDVRHSETEITKAGVCPGIYWT